MWRVRRICSARSRFEMSVRTFGQESDRTGKRLVPPLLTPLPQGERKDASFSLEREGQVEDPGRGGGEGD
jgi:hypothetical protein